MREIDRGAIAAYVVAAVLLGFVLLRLLGGGGSDPPPVRVASGTPAADAGQAAPGEPRKERDGIVVHVAGAVRNPGLVTLARGARVAGAVEAAGGPGRGADLSALNLAAPVGDGQQVVVPRRGQAGAAAPAAASGGAGTPGGDAAGAPGAPGAPKISLSTATVDQLDQLDGIGPTIARRIVAQRQERGGFRSVEDLRSVDGIGDKRLESLRAALDP